ncbi:unknown [Ruminococcus sp. CAG:353]|nr:unknown [Ruminococcus sp. CAG:353]
MTCKTYCQYNISRKLFYLTVITDRKMNCINEYDRIYFIKMAILPLFYLWEQPVGNIRHHSVTYFKAVNILNSFAYLTGRHTFRCLDIILLQQSCYDVLLALAHWLSFSSSHIFSSSCVISILPQFFVFYRLFFIGTCSSPFYSAACARSPLSVALFGLHF